MWPTCEPISLIFNVNESRVSASLLTSSMVFLNILVLLKLLKKEKKEDENNKRRKKEKIKNSRLYATKKENEKIIWNRVKIIKQELEGGKKWKTNGNGDDEIWMSTMRPDRSLKIVNKTDMRIFRFHGGFVVSFQ